MARLAGQANATMGKLGEGYGMENWQDWQKPYQHGMMVIWPPAAVRKTVNQQRESLDPLSASYCEAHISLTQPLIN